MTYTDCLVGLLVIPLRGNGLRKEPNFFIVILSVGEIIAIKLFQMFLHQFQIALEGNQKLVMTLHEFVDISLTVKNTIHDKSLAFSFSAW